MCSVYRHYANFMVVIVEIYPTVAKTQATGQNGGERRNPLNFHPFVWQHGNSMAVFISCTVVVVIGDRKAIETSYLENHIKPCQGVLCGAKRALRNNENRRQRNYFR